jgi:hypothetical protein
LQIDYDNIQPNREDGTGEKRKLCNELDHNLFISCRIIRVNKLRRVNMMFMCPCITSIIINDDQQDAAIPDLFISSLLYMFRATASPIIRSTTVLTASDIVNQYSCWLVSWMK